MHILCCISVKLNFILNNKKYLSCQFFFIRKSPHKELPFSQVPYNYIKNKSKKIIITMQVKRFPDIVRDLNKIN
jgi:hypothetical protein